MKALPPEPTRLVAGEQGTKRDIEARAAALLRSLPAPPTPRPADLARIRERVRVAVALGSPPRLGWAPGLLLFGASSLLILCWVAIGSHRVPATVTEHIHLADGQVLRLSTKIPDRELSFAGPAEATREGEGDIRMDRGHGAITAGARPVEIWIRRVHVSFAAYSQGVVDAAGDWIKVSALAGDVSIGTSSGRTATLAPGSQWEDGSPPETQTVPPTDVTSMFRSPEPGAQVEDAAPRHRPRGRYDRDRDEPEVAEARWLGQVLRRMRVDRDPAAALEMLEGYERRFPDHRLQSEVVLARVESSLALGRRAEALGLLESGSVASGSKRPQLALVRGELRAGAGRCAEAVSDFDVVLRSGGSDPMAERALYGRAICQRTLGHGEAARRDFGEYVRRFPAGAFAVSARAYLNGQ